jgi:soluble epoxide hydrolase / lipid-phosphate phosphatase
MTIPPPITVVTNGIPMSVHCAGRGPSVVLLHGFPELAYSWRHQIAALSQAGWTAIAPDQRGHGATGCHGELSAYRMENLALDIIGLLDALEIERAVVVGHDFGGAVVWTLARLHPSRIVGVASLNTPYTGRAARDLVSTMLQYRGPENYMVRFQEPGLGEELLGRDIDGMFASLMRRPLRTLEAFRRECPQLQCLPVSLLTGEPEVMGEPFMAPDETRIYAEAFSKTGFTGALSWYRNLRHSWEDSADKPERIEAPALMISAADDYFLPPETTSGMEQFIPDLERALIPDCGHWTQNERPEETNRLLLDWLERRMRPLF